jgi:hypothetical protein
VFLNNDVVPKAGWLDALVRYAESHPKAAAVGSKLLFPDGTVQHAGVVICQDLYPRHLYAGFPAEHPAVNRSRRFQIVTAASVLFRRKPFEEAGGFDAAYLNGFEDVDLCLRLGERGHEVHYCHESVGYHLEGVSEGRAKAEKENFRLYRERWNHSLQPDDVQYYLEDGLLGMGYARSYPIRLKASPLLAVVEGDERERQSDRLLNLRSLQVFELLKETVRLTVRVQEAELRAAPDERTGFHRRDLLKRDGGSVDTRHKIDALRRVIPEPVRRSEASAAGAASAPDREEGLRAMLLEAHEQLMRRDGEIEALVHDLQADLAALPQRDAPDGGGDASATIGSFVPGTYLRYRQLVRRIWQVARTNLPSGATVVVVSRGDEALLELDDCSRSWHFPQGEGGVYAGHYPTDDAEAISHLEELRAKGGEFLLLPETSLWWLEHYGGFREHLEEHYRPFVREEGTCLIFDLREPPETAHRPTPVRIKDTGNVDHRDTPA